MDLKPNNVTRPSRHTLPQLIDNELPQKFINEQDGNVPKVIGWRQSHLAHDGRQSPIDQYPNHLGNQPPAHTTNVEVNNNGNYYRPWKEEIAISFARSLGNFCAFPFRLIGGVFEGVFAAGIRLMKLVIFAVLAPTLLYTGMQMYKASENGETLVEAAAAVGKQSIGLMGAVLGGIWDGIFGDDEPAPPEKAK